MLQSGFVVAMAADIDLAKYEQPASITRRIRRWLIVSRLGADGEHLTVSEGGLLSNAPSEAPIGIRPIKTLLGILLSETGSGDCTFIIARQRSEDLYLAGTFFPAEGYVQLSGGIESLTLHAEGRHAHSRGSHHGVEVRNYIADPAPNSRLAMAWHINAARRPWTGEFVAHA